MIVQETKNANSAAHEIVLRDLPHGAEIQPVAFVTQRDPDQHLLLEFPQPFGRFAVLVKPESSETNGHTKDDFQFLTVPTANHQNEDMLSVVQDWVEAATAETSTPLQMMRLQGAQVFFWNAHRVGILAPAENLRSVRSAMIEVCWYESELSEIERSLADAWPDMESDMTLAFEFNEQAIKKRPQLLKRFQRVAMIRSRFARLAPQVYCPHVHPPTMASQVSERFRERSRMLHRHEILGEQIEVFEKVYESCGQRASDFAQSRTGHMLEWIIVVLLLTQILFTGFDYLTSFNTTEVSPTNIQATETTNVESSELGQ